MGKRYCANKDEQRTEVHDLDDEKLECGIDKIWHAHVDMYENLDNALKAGYKKCKLCFVEPVKK